MDPRKSQLTFKILLYFCFAIILPTFLVYSLFWSTENTKIPILNQKADSGEIKVILGTNENSWRWTQVVRQIFQVPFDLSTYNICLRNRTKVVGASGEKYLAVQTEIKDASGKVIFPLIYLSEKGEACGELNISPFSIGVVTTTPYYIPAEFLPARISLEVDVAANEEQGAQPTFPSQVASTFIFLFAYAGSLKLIHEFSRWTKRTFFLIRKLQERKNDL